MPAYLHLKAQRNSISTFTDQALRLNNYSKAPQHHGTELNKGYLSSFNRTQAVSTVSQEAGARAKKCIQWQQRMYLQKQEEAQQASGIHVGSEIYRKCQREHADERLK